MQEKCWLTHAWPHLKPASGDGPHVLCLPRKSPAWTLLRETFNIDTVPDFLKHLFNKHCGEVRLIQDFGWKLLDPHLSLHPRFWHSQFARTERTQFWLSNRKSDKSLTWKEAAWVLDTDGGQTTLLRRARRHPWRSAASGAMAPRKVDFDVEVRVGQVVTLAQLFYLGAEFCCAFDMYR